MTYRHPSPKTDRAYDFIVATIEAGHPFPSLQEIADHLGCPKDRAGALDILHRIKMRCQIRIKSRTRTPRGRGWSFEWELAHWAPGGSSREALASKAPTP